MDRLDEDWTLYAVPVLDEEAAAQCNYQPTGQQPALFPPGHDHSRQTFPSALVSPLHSSYPSTTTTTSSGQLSIPSSYVREYGPVPSIASGYIPCLPTSYPQHETTEQQHYSLPETASLSSAHGYASSSFLGESSMADWMVGSSINQFGDYVTAPPVKTTSQTVHSGFPISAMDRVPEDLELNSDFAEEFLAGEATAATAEFKSRPQNPVPDSPQSIGGDPLALEDHKWDPHEFHSWKLQSQGRVASPSETSVMDEFTGAGSTVTVETGRESVPPAEQLDDAEVPSLQAKLDLESHPHWQEANRFATTCLLRDKVLARCKQQGKDMPDIAFHPSDPRNRELTEEEKRKIERKKLGNKMSARKSRQKKTTEKHRKAEELEELERKNAGLLETIQALEAEKDQFLRLIPQYKHDELKLRLQAARHEHRREMAEQEEERRSKKLHKHGGFNRGVP